MQKNELENVPGRHLNLNSTEQESSTLFGTIAQTEVGTKKI